MPVKRGPHFPMTQEQHNCDQLLRNFQLSIYIQPSLLLSAWCAETVHACACDTSVCTQHHVSASHVSLGVILFIAAYRRLWLFSAPRQLGAYYYISAYIITVTWPGLLSACALSRIIDTSCVISTIANTSTRACVRSDDRNAKQNAVIAMAQATLEGNISITRVSCFLSNNLFWSWSPYPFENVVASHHTFVKKNRVV